MVVRQKFFLLGERANLAAEVDAHDAKTEENHHDYIPQLVNESVVRAAEESIEESHLWRLFFFDSGADIDCGLILDLERIVFEGAATIRHSLFRLHLGLVHHARVLVGTDSFFEFGTAVFEVAVV